MPDSNSDQDRVMSPHGKYQYSPPPLQLRTCTLKSATAIGTSLACYPAAAGSSSAGSTTDLLPDPIDTSPNSTAYPRNGLDATREARVPIADLLPNPVNTATYATPDPRDRPDAAREAWIGVADLLPGTVHAASDATADFRNRLDAARQALSRCRTRIQQQKANQCDCEWKRRDPVRHGRSFMMPAEYLRYPVCARTDAKGIAGLR